MTEQQQTAAAKLCAAPIIKAAFLTRDIAGGTEWEHAGDMNTWIAAHIRTTGEEDDEQKIVNICTENIAAEISAVIIDSSQTL